MKVAVDGVVEGPRRLLRPQIALDVARGLAYLHSRRIIHFDLKSPNILLARWVGGGRDRSAALCSAWQHNFPAEAIRAAARSGGARHRLLPPWQQCLDVC